LVFAAVLTAAALTATAFAATALTATAFAATGFAATIARAVAALATPAVSSAAPQVFLDPAERTALQLPHAFFDDKLRALDAAGVPLRPSLVSLVPLVPLVSRRAAVHGTTPAADGGCGDVDGRADGRAAPPLPLLQRVHGAPTTRLLLHVGGNCPGDVTEAALLQQAAAEAAAEEAAEEAAEASAAPGADAAAPRDGAARGAAVAVVEVTVHRRCGHAVASRIRDAGKLDPLLRRCIGGGVEPTASREAASGAPTSTTHGRSRVS